MHSYCQEKAITHESLLRAKKQAVKFDDNSKDDLDTIRFIGARGKEKVKAKVYDDMGTTASLELRMLLLRLKMRS